MLGQCHCQREYPYYGTFVSLNSEHLEMSLGLEGGQYTLRHRSIPQITQTGNVFGKFAGPKSIDMYLGILFNISQSYLLIIDN